MKGHTHSRCFKWEAWRASLRRKDKQSHLCCQAIGREVRIIHHRVGEYPPRPFVSRVWEKDSRAGKDWRPGSFFCEEGRLALC